MADSSQHSKMAVMVTARWGAKAIELTLSPADWATISFEEFCNLLETETDIPADRMKILGIHNEEKKQPSKTELLKELVFKKNDRSFMLIGTARSNFLKEPEEDTDVVPLYDIILPPATVQQRLQAAIETTDLRWINNANPNKKLLVLDLDYTLFDCHGTRDMRLPISEYKRPFFDSFLKEAFESFNLCIWSQTSWTWVEAKVTELGMLSSDDYKIVFCLDQSSMFTVRAVRRGTSEERTHQVKALEIIWRLCPMFGPHNTLHVDDLSRNFALNPKNGIKVHAFRRRRRSDTELKQLSKYLRRCASMADLTQHDHTSWREK